MSCLCGCGRPTPIAKKTRSAYGYVQGEPMPYADRGCHTRVTHATEWSLDEVMRRVTVTADGCWIWKLSRNPQGYGQIRRRTRTLRAHRFVYELLVGPVSDALHLDHICHSSAQPPCYAGPKCPHRACVNPDHLEPVTPAENRRRVRRAAA